MRYEVAGLGNAIVDVLVRIPEDEVLTEQGLTRGLMHPVDHHRWSQVYEAVKPHGAEIATGGSCANTIATMGLAGRRVTYCGQVGDDQFGALYIRDMQEACGAQDLHVAKGRNTAKCLSLISASDAERTMLTHLGAAVDLPDIGTFAESIRQSRLLHVTGYLFLGGPMAEAAKEALDVARAAGVPISLDVADPFVVNTVREEMWRVVRDYAQIVFLNAEEARALTGLPPAEAIHAVAAEVGTVVVKQGSQGSLIKHHGDLYRVGVHPVTPVDTTGAGDAYAAGYLYGWVEGWEPARCGDLGARFASLTVGQLGGVVRDREALQRAVHAAEAG
ncbi:MAG: adenosine kinase [Alphaproteobacteria bacterium]|nr:adenosine kinase [Alphaproteobacteria bacterium]MCB9791863.1 adenosine kinase [Alphaproteobacteria bacterium]